MLFAGQAVESKSGNENPDNHRIQESARGGSRSAKDDVDIGNAARVAGRGTSGRAAFAGGDGGGEGKGEPQTPAPALSLLERIRRDAKKKRRQGAAAAAAAAVGQNGQR